MAIIILDEINKQEKLTSDHLPYTNFIACVFFKIYFSSWLLESTSIQSSQNKFSDISLVYFDSKKKASAFF